MSFLKDTNYSGSRKYDGQAPDNDRAANLRLTWSLTIAWAALQLKKFVRRGLAAAQPAQRVEHGFTLLGTEQRRVPVRRPISELFPISTSNEQASRIRHEN